MRQIKLPFTREQWYNIKLAFVYFLGFTVLPTSLYLAYLFIAGVLPMAQHAGLVILTGFGIPIGLFFTLYTIGMINKNHIAHRWPIFIFKDELRKIESKDRTTLEGN